MNSNHKWKGENDLGNEYKELKKKQERKEKELRKT